MTKLLSFSFSVLFMISVGCKQISIKNQIQSESRYTNKHDSSFEDIPYHKYYSSLDTTKGAVIYDENNNPAGVEPTFSDRYLKNKQIDTSKTVFINKAYTAQEIAKCIILDRYGKGKLKEIEKFDIILVDNKFWCITFSLNKHAFGGTNVILISKYDGKILEWSNLQ